MEAVAKKLDADDPRVQWLAQKVCASLGCDVASFTKLIQWPTRPPRAGRRKASKSTRRWVKCCGWTCAAPFEPLEKRRVECLTRWSIRASRSLYRNLVISEGRGFPLGPDLCASTAAD